MAKIKVKLNLSTKSDTELLTFAQGHVTAMTGIQGAINELVLELNA